MNILAGFMSFVSVEGIIGKLGIRNDGSYGSYGSYEYSRSLNVSIRLQGQCRIIAILYKS